MSAYATVEDIQNHLLRELSTDEEALCETLLADSAIIIDAYNSSASADSKKLVSVRMVIRNLDSGDGSVPVGATQGSMSGLGYTSSWTIGTGGGNGELYISKLEKKLLGLGDKIGSYSPIEG